MTKLVENAIYAVCMLAIAAALTPANARSRSGIAKHEVQAQPASSPEQAHIADLAAQVAAWRAATQAAIKQRDDAENRLLDLVYQGAYSEAKNPKP